MDGEERTQNTTFEATLNGKQVSVKSKFGGKTIGLVMDVKPGDESFISTPHARRVAMVDSKSVRKQGNGVITEATIGSIRYTLDEETRKFECSQKNSKSFPLRNGTTIRYSGTIQSSGESKDFSTSVKLNFKKK